MRQLNQETVVTRFGVNCDDNHGAVIPPLYLSSNFAFPKFGEKGRYDYTRSGNPTRDQLAGALAAAEGGAGAVITATGMAAVHLATQLLQSGDVLVAPPDCYGGCHRLLSAAVRKSQFKVEWVPLWETAAAVEQIATLKPRMVWIETPSNPLLRITDVEVIAEAAHAVGALVVADNTFLSPAGQSPLALGADIVIHSTTKYINGHSDVVGGALICKEQELLEELAWWGNCLGLTGSPFDSFQTLRGLRTLAVRYRQHQENAALVAEALNSNELVEQVYFPGLKDHPGHEIAARQQRGFGAMISFELAGDESEIPVFLHALKLFTLAESLGGVESLVAHPATMTHAAMSAEDQAKAGISSRLLRLSVGIEHVDDLLADLANGFAAVKQSRLESVATSAQPVRKVAC
ncbi:MAG TPA: cystathionine gamma-synthase [Xanthomonadales bacterium]|nr:cystathionine gamma-synthase [Xanthomonadales bacterium]